MFFKRRTISLLIIFVLVFLVTTTSGIKTNLVKGEEERKILIDDNCSSFNYVSKSLSTMNTIRIENGHINRNYATETAQGPKGVNNKAPKYYPSEIVYKTYADIKDFEVSALVYLYEKGYDQYYKFEALEGVASYRVEIHLSPDGKNWTVVPVSLEAFDPGDPVLYPTKDFCGITFTNKGIVPSGMRFLKVVLVGQVAVVNFMGMEYVLDGTDGYANISSNPNYTFDDIIRYWNAWAPILTGVKIYADKDAEIETAVATLSARGSSKSFRKGEEYKFVAEYTLSTDPSSHKVENFEEFNIDILEGEEYVEVDRVNGTMRIKEDFDEQNATISFQIEKDGVASDTVIVSLIVPVESVSLISEVRRVRVGSGYVPIGIEIYPFTATNTSPDWIVKDSNGNVVTDVVSITLDGMLKPLKDGQITISAVVDGVESNSISLTIEPKPSLVIKNDLVLKVGDRVNLEAQIAPLSMASSVVTWTILGDDGVATIEDNNILVCKKVGIFTLRASVEGASVEKYGESWMIEEEKIEQKGCNNSLHLSGVAILSMSIILVIKRRKK